MKTFIFGIMGIALVATSCKIKQGTSNTETVTKAPEKTEIKEPTYTSKFLPRKVILSSNPTDTIFIDNLHLAKGKDSLTITQLLAKIPLPKTCTSIGVEGKSTYKIVLNADQTFGEVTLLKSANECLAPMAAEVDKQLKGWKSTRGVGEEVHFILYHMIEVAPSKN